MRSSTVIISEIKKIQATDKKYNHVANEGGEGYQRQSVPQALFDELAAAQDAEFAQKWTPDFTSKNRLAWNETAKSLGDKATQFLLEEKFGFSFYDLKKAIKINCL